MTKEEANYDPSKTETLSVYLDVNDGPNKRVVRGSIPWIIGDFEDKMQAALGVDPLTSLEIKLLKCKSSVANEFLDALCCYDMNEHGIDKLIISSLVKDCEPISEEVVSRLAEICPRPSHLQLSDLSYLTETGKLSMVNLFRQILDNNPPIKVLNMKRFK